MDYSWPDGLIPQTMAWQIQKAGVAFRSPYAGSTETVVFPGWFWKISVTLPPRRFADGAIRAFFNRLAGGRDRVLVPYWLQPVPRGSMRGAPVVAALALRGSPTLQITTGGTLKAGDLFKVGNKVFETFTDCAPIAGVLTVPLTESVNSTIAAGTPVGWDHPTVRCLMPAFQNSTSYQPGLMEGTAIDLEEAP